MILNAIGNVTTVFVITFACVLIAFFPQWGRNLAPQNGSITSYKYPIAMSTVFGGVANAYGTNADVFIRFVGEFTIQVQHL